MDSGKKGVSIAEFKELGITEKILQGITGLGFTNPTDVQEKAIPGLIAGKQLIVRSKTGTGKTLAFGVGALEMLEAKKARKALVLAPVRELAIQIMNELRDLGKFCHYRIICAYGGQDIDVQIGLIYRGVDILVATPGRLLDLFERGIIDLNDYDFVVVDEADKMFEMGFVEDVDRILSNTSYARKLQFFSATINNDVQRLYTKYVKEFEIIEVGPEEKPPDIEEERITLDRPQKFEKLVEIIKKQREIDPIGKILIFVATQRAAEYVGKRLYATGIGASFIHGDLRQRRRESIMSEFKGGESGILVATDVAARGLHIDDIGLVINYDEAGDSTTHLHRIGRTGRMGSKGKAITFVDENPYFRKPSNPSFRLKVGPYNPGFGRPHGPGGHSGPREGGYGSRPQGGRYGSYRPSGGYGQSREGYREGRPSGAHGYGRFGARTHRPRPRR